MSPYVGMPGASAGLYTPPPTTASPLGPSFGGFPTSPSPFYPPPNSFNGGDALIGAMGRLNLSPSYPGAATQVDNESVSQFSAGPSANNRKLGLYKTELCRSWEEKGSCRYGAKCQFAHSEGEVRKVSRHPKYKTEICRTFWVSGSCPYGKRCCFIHTELPANGTAPGADGSSPPKLAQGMMSENHLSSNNGSSMASPVGSDVQQISLLQRISAQHEAALAVNSPIDQRVSGDMQFSKPANGTLRLDISGLPANTNSPFTSNPTMVSTENRGNRASPLIPATAGPDFGRQASARAEIVGFNGSNAADALRGLPTTKTNRDSQLRHSFNGTEAGLSLNSPESSSVNLPSVAFSSGTPDRGGSQTPTSNTHQRSGSAGQWPTGSLGSRNSANANPVSPVGYMGHVPGHGEGGNPWKLGESNAARQRLSGTWL